MPIFKKEGANLKSVTVNNFDSIKCCMCKPKDYKPTFRYNGIQQKMFYCKNCGYQLTFKQLDAFSHSTECDKQVAALNK